MRIRPFFWLILFVTCGSVLALACMYQPHAPTILQVSMMQKQFVAGGPSSLKLSLTDPDGQPINQAQVIPSARMTNMEMAVKSSHVMSSGSGTYTIDLDLSMAGPWSITIQTRAPGFATQEKTLQVIVNNAQTDT
jgi:hypothetical protein